MRQIRRLLGFLRPYSFRFCVAVVLMAVVGACEALMALLIRPVFDSVLKPAGQTAKVFLFQLPSHPRAVYLQDFLPRRIHNTWTIVAIAIIAVIIAKGLSEYFATYFMNFIGHSIVRDLRDRV